MKTKSIILTATLIITVVAIFLLAPARGFSQGKAEKTGSIPANLYKIFENSCMGCHANGGKPMAMSQLNFSNWDEYPVDKQAKKAEAIQKMLLKGAMPPKSFRASRPDAVPTDEQVKLISAWADKLNPKK